MAIFQFSVSFIVCHCTKLTSKSFAWEATVLLTGNDIHCSSNYRLNRSINYSSSFYCCSFATKLGLMEKSMLYNFQISKLHSFNHFQSLLKCETSYFLKFNASTQSHQAYLIKTAVIQRQIDKTNRL